MAYLKEAFQKLNLLEDVEFDIDERDSAEQLQKFLNDEDERELDNIEMIVDVDASEEDELKDSYVGSLLLYCPTCHTIHYAKKEDIVKDEENPTLVNVGEPCPNCDEVEGFEIKGEVAPYEPNKEIEDNEETEEDDIEIDDDDFEIEDEEDFLERLNTKTTNKPLKENLSKKKTNKKSMLESLIDGDLSRDDFDENENYPDLDDSDKDLLKDDIEEKVGSTLPRVRKQIKEGKLEEDPIYDLKPRYDARNSFYNKAVVDTGDKGDQNKLYSYDTLVAEIKDGKPVVYGTYSQTTLRHIKEWLKQLGFKAESSKQIMNDYGVKEESCKENLKEEVQDEAYEIADYILDKIKDKDTITWNEFEDLVNDGCKELYGVDLYNEVNDNDKVTINDKEFDVNDLVNGDIRGILSYSGWSTVYEGENEGGLTTLDENLKEAKEFIKFKGNGGYYSQYRDDFTIKVNDYCVVNFPFTAMAKVSDKEDAKYVPVKLTGYYRSGRLIKNEPLFTTIWALYKGSEVFGGYTQSSSVSPVWSNDDDNKSDVRVRPRDIKNLDKYYRKATKEDVLNYFSDSEVIEESLNRKAQLVKNLKERLDEKKTRPLKESRADAQNFIDSLIEYAQDSIDNGSDIDTAIAETIDSQLIYSSDILDLANYYGVIDDSELIDKFIEDLYNDIYSGVHEKELSYEDKLEEYGLPQEEYYSFEEIADAENLEIEDLKEMDEDELRDHIADTFEYNYDYKTEDFDFTVDDDGVNVTNITWDLDESLKESTKQDDIDAKADDKKEVAKKDYEKEVDDADADKDDEFDEIDESLFDNLVNKYCVRVYENVDNYKTTSGSIEDNKLMLEGILTYKSGKTTNTKFMFEKLITKDGKLKFVGLNETFSKSKKAFSLNCKMDGNKIITESLTYNYKVKVNDDKKVVYGSIKNN